jgi:Aspartyl protease
VAATALIERLSMLRFGVALAALSMLFVQAADADEQYTPVTLSLAQFFALTHHYRTTERLGNFVWASGSDDGRRWSEDANGVVTQSSNLFSEVDPFSVALRAPENPTGGVKLLGMTAGPSPQYVVEVTPSSGLVERCYYDAHSYLLARVERVDYDGHRQVWEYDDYRNVYGRNFAHLVRYERDGSTVTEQTQLLTYERLSGSVPSLAMPLSHPLFDLGSATSVTVPADFTQDGIFVPVILAGRKLGFELDSGSSDILLDPGVAKELGMETTGAYTLSFAGDINLANARAPSVTIGALSATNVAFSTAGLAEDLPGRRVVGLLGTDFIASDALEVDFEKSQLTMYRALPTGLAAQGWSALPLRLDYDVPMLKANFSGLDGYFVADLGASDTTLFPHYFSRYPKHVPPGTPDEFQMVTLGNHPFGVKGITMRSMVLGDWVFGDVQVVVPSAQYAQGRDYDGLIGRNTLSNFDLIFDYADSQLWFKPIDFK